MGAEGMNIERLWEILYKERSSPLLQELPQNFYEEVRDYIRRLEQEKEKADDTRKAFIEDEIRSARAKIEDIFRRRIGKIVKMASAGAKTCPKGLTPDEKAIFEGVASCVEEGRKRIMRAIFGETKDEKKENESGSYASSQDDVVAGTTVVSVDVKQLAEQESVSEHAKEAASGDAGAADATDEMAVANRDATANAAVMEKLCVVRMLESVPAFIGVDGRVYKVRREDVLTLPKDNAEILCKKGVAVQLSVRRRWS